MAIGPSLGHFYAARPGRALGGIGLRTLALLGVAGGVAVAWDSEDAGGGALALLGLGLCGTSLIADIATAPHSVQIHNDNMQEGRIAFGITPSRHTPGLGLRAEVCF